MNWKEHPQYLAKKWKSKYKEWTPAGKNLAAWLESEQANPFREGLTEQNYMADTEINWESNEATVKEDPPKAPNDRPYADDL
jgi:hypothetical protein